MRLFLSLFMVLWMHTTNAIALDKSPMPKFANPEHRQLLVEVAIGELGFATKKGFKSDMHKMYFRYEESLQRKFRDNIHAIMEAANGADGKPTNFALEMFEYIIGQNDFRIRVFSNLNKKARPYNLRAQILLKFSGYPVQLNGEFDELTLEATKAYFKEFKGMNDTHFRFTNNDGPNPIFKHELATSVIKHDLKNGTLAILPEFLPKGMTDPGTIAGHLSIEKNYQSYFEALYNKDYSSLIKHLETVAKQ